MQRNYVLGNKTKTNRKRIGPFSRVTFLEVHVPIMDRRNMEESGRCGSPDRCPRSAGRNRLGWIGGPGICKTAVRSLRRRCGVKITLLKPRIFFTVTFAHTLCRSQIGLILRDLGFFGTTSFFLCTGDMRKKGEQHRWAPKERHLLPFPLSCSSTTTRDRSDV
jgi:hypothetical protein